MLSRSVWLWRRPALDWLVSCVYLVGGEECWRNSVRTYSAGAYSGDNCECSASHVEGRIRDRDRIEYGTIS